VKEFYVLSLKYSNATYWRWWGPNNCGYVDDLNQAGRYPEAAIREKASYYNDGESTLAVPCEVVDTLQSQRVVYMRGDDHRKMIAASKRALGEPTERKYS